MQVTQKTFRGSEVSFLQRSVAGTLHSGDGIVTLVATTSHSKMQVFCNNGTVVRVIDTSCGVTHELCADKNGILRGRERVLGPFPQKNSRWNPPRFVVGVYLPNNAYDFGKLLWMPLDTNSSE